MQHMAQLLPQQHSRPAGRDFLDPILVVASSTPRLDHDHDPDVLLQQSRFVHCMHQNAILIALGKSESNSNAQCPSHQPYHLLWFRAKNIMPRVLFELLPYAEKSTYAHIIKL